MKKYKDLLSEAKHTFSKINLDEKSVTQKYVVAKVVFSHCQRVKEVHWSTDCVYNGFGEFVGVRLNSNFFKRSEVKRQIRAAKR